MKRFGLKQMWVLTPALVFTVFQTMTLASPISSGTASIIGQANLGGLAGPNGASLFDLLGTTPNIFNVNSGLGSFAGLSGGAIQNLSNFGGAQTNYTTFVGPAGGPVLFDLKSVAPGLGIVAACFSDVVGNICTPLGSPWTLTQKDAKTVDITWQLVGVSYEGSFSTGTSATNASFDLTVAGTMTAVVAALSAVGGLGQNQYQGTFTTTSTAPQPGTILIMLGGLVGMVAVRFIIDKTNAKCESMPTIL